MKMEDFVFDRKALEDIKVEDRLRTPSDLDVPVFVVCPPIIQGISVENNVYMQELTEEQRKLLNVDELVAQWMNVVRILSMEALVLTLPPNPLLQDLVWVNSFVYLPHVDEPTCIISSFKAEGREPESDLAEWFLNEMGYKTYRPPNPEWTFEGEPCMKYLYDNIYICSYGERTSPEALDWIAEKFDCRLIKLGRESEICYDSKTEILTLDGWKFFWQLSEDDLVATFNPETGNIEYQKPIKLIKINYSGDVYHFNGKRMDLRVTADHYVFRSADPRKGLSSFKFIKAKNFRIGSSQYISFLCAGDFDVEDPKEIEIAGKKFDYKDIVRLLAWYISEGSCGQDSIFISQYDKNNLNEIQELVSRLGLSYSLNEKGIIIYSHSFAEFVVSNCGKTSRSKRVPLFIKLSSSETIREFVEILVKGDGDKRIRKFDYRRKKEYNCYTMTYYTCSKQLADDVQELCVKCGLRSKVRKVFRINSINYLGNLEEYVVDIDYNKTYCTGCVRENLEVERVSNEEFYDVSVPKYHLLVVRRNGCVCISSNSYHGDTIFCPISPTKVMVVIPSADKKALKELERFAEIIPIEDAALGEFCITNNIPVGYKILAGTYIELFEPNSEEWKIERKKIDVLEEISAENGYDLILFDVSQFYLFGAALSCVASRLNYIDRLPMKEWSKYGK